MEPKSLLLNFCLISYQNSKNFVENCQIFCFTFGPAQIYPEKLENLVIFQRFWCCHHPFMWPRGIMFGLLETTNDILGMGKVLFDFN